MYISKYISENPQVEHSACLKFGLSPNTYVVQQKKKK